MTESQESATLRRLNATSLLWDALLERYLAPARRSLGAEHEAVRAEGRALAFEDAVDLALHAGGRS